MGLAKESDSQSEQGSGWTRGKPSRLMWYLIAGVLGFWLALVLVGQYTDWVPPGVLFEIFLVSTIVLGLAVPAAALTCRMEDRDSGPSDGGSPQKRDERGQEQESEGE